MMSKTKGPIPPVILLVFILGEVALHNLAPITHLIPSPWNLAGVGLIVVGVLIVIGPATAFSRAGTTIKPFEDSSALVTTGMYRITRNPMYLGMVTVLIGIAVLTGSLSPFVGPVLFVPVLNSRIIRHEEVMLEDQFGDEYRSFKQSVRRWI